MPNERRKDIQQCRRGTENRSNGFTLIELLIVVAIIAILAAIAVPNFLEAQTRAKVARVKADMRSAETALETYVMDYGKYPPFNYANSALNWNQNNRGPIQYLVELTTPVAYMSSIDLKDPFLPPGNRNTGRNNGEEVTTLWYTNIMLARQQSGMSVVPQKWVLASFGPDFVFTGKVGGYMSNLAVDDPNGYYPNYEPWLYDATNGTKSAGDIVRYSGGYGSR